MNMKKAILLSLSVIFAALISMPSAAFAGGQDPSAPDFILTDLDGKQLTLASFKDKVLFINFWGTWCPPCRAEIPSFVEAYEKHKDKGMVILGITVNDRSAAKVADFVKSNKISYPIAMGTNQVISDFGPINAVPTTIVVDRQGFIRHRHVGIMDTAALEKLFQEFSK